MFSHIDYFVVAMGGLSLFMALYTYIAIKIKLARTSKCYMSKKEYSNIKRGYIGIWLFIIGGILVIFVGFI